MLTVGSLFAGIGGIELGLEWTGGFRTVWQVECDDYATRVLERHWPDVARFRDVRGCRGLPYVDAVVGGFPCQDVSVAGRRAGLAGARSGLWSEFARIVGEVGPRYVLVENVPGLLSADGGDAFGTVLGDLAALGYDAWWDCLSAVAVGAPHRRDRVFVVAYRADARGAGRRQELRGAHGDEGADARRGALDLHEPSRDGAVGDVADGAEHGRGPRGTGRPAERDTGIRQSAPRADVPDAGRQMPQERDGTPGERTRATVGRRGWWAAQPRMGDLADGLPARLDGCWRAEPDVPRVAHGVPNRVDRLRCLGNAVVPQVAYVIGCWILEANDGR